MKRVAILQARSGSSRLPRKVLADLGGRPMLARVVERLKRCPQIDEIVVATTLHADDDAVVSVAEGEGVAVFRGSEHDVLSRYVGAARAVAAELIVRVTADCPLLDAGVVGRVVTELEMHAADADYASNVIARTFPRGLDAEAFFADTLERLARMAASAAAREHVTYYVLRERPDLFVVRSVVDAEDHSDLRWTVDEPADLEMVRRLYRALDLGTAMPSYRETLAFVRAHPAIGQVNAAVQQKAH